MSDAGSLIGRGPLLLDFDGPVCSIFAGYPAPRVAQELVAMLRAAGVDVPDTTAEQIDPLEVLRWVGASCSPDITTATEDALCAAELRAAATAAPTPYGHDVIRAAHGLGVPVAVVSNNSAGAVAAYLSAHGLTPYVHPVVGRAYGDPGRMKPNPEPILTAVRALRAAAGDCVLIGDSLSDIEGARAAGVRVIGYANQPWKVGPFTDADRIVTSMREILSGLRSL
jgi:HAD superfamily hydrolase (TIGR01509 family)